MRPELRRRISKFKFEGVEAEPTSELVTDVA